MRMRRVHVQSAAGASMVRQQQLLRLAVFGVTLLMLTSTCATTTGTHGGAIPCPATSHRCTSHDDCACARPRERLTHHHAKHVCYSCGTVQGLRASEAAGHQLQCASGVGTCTEHQGCVCPAAGGFRKVSHSVKADRTVTAALHPHGGDDWNPRCYSCTNQAHVHLDTPDTAVLPEQPPGTPVGTKEVVATAAHVSLYHLIAMYDSIPTPSMCAMEGIVTAHDHAQQRAIVWVWVTNSYNATTFQAQFGDSFANSEYTTVVAKHADMATLIQDTPFKPAFV